MNPKDLGKLVNRMVREFTLKIVDGDEITDVTGGPLHLEYRKTDQRIRLFLRTPDGKEYRIARYSPADDFAYTAAERFAFMLGRGAELVRYGPTWLLTPLDPGWFREYKKTT